MSSSFDPDDATKDAVIRFLKSNHVDIPKNQNKPVYVELAKKFLAEQEAAKQRASQSTSTASSRASSRGAARPTVPAPVVSEEWDTFMSSTSSAPSSTSASKRAATSMSTSSASTSTPSRAPTTASSSGSAYEFGFNPLSDDAFRNRNRLSLDPQHNPFQQGRTSLDRLSVGDANNNSATPGSNGGGARRGLTGAIVGTGREASAWEFSPNDRAIAMLNRAALAPSSSAYKPAYSPATSPSSASTSTSSSASVPSSSSSTTGRASLLARMGDLFSPFRSTQPSPSSAASPSTSTSTSASPSRTRAKWDKSGGVTPGALQSSTSTTTPAPAPASSSVLGRRYTSASTVSGTSSARRSGRAIDRAFESAIVDETNTDGNVDDEDDVSNVNIGFSRSSRSARTPTASGRTPALLSTAAATAKPTPSSSRSRGRGRTNTRRALDADEHVDQQEEEDGASRRASRAGTTSRTRGRQASTRLGSVNDAMAAEEVYYAEQHYDDDDDDAEDDDRVFAAHDNDDGDDAAHIKYRRKSSSSSSSPKSFSSSLLSTFSSSSSSSWRLPVLYTCIALLFALAVYLCLDIFTDPGTRFCDSDGTSLAATPVGLLGSGVATGAGAGDVHGDTHDHRTTPVGTAVATTTGGGASASRTPRVVDNCVPCPPLASCVGGVMTCQPPFVRVGDRCDDSAFLHKVADVIHKHAGSFDCNQQTFQAIWNILSSIGSTIYSWLPSYIAAVVGILSYIIAPIGYIINLLATLLLPPTDPIGTHAPSDPLLSRHSLIVWIMQKYGFGLTHSQAGAALSHFRDVARTQQEIFKVVVESNPIEGGEKYRSLAPEHSWACAIKLWFLNPFNIIIIAASLAFANYVYTRYHRWSYARRYEARKQVLQNAVTVIMNGVAQDVVKCTEELNRLSHRSYAEASASQNAWPRAKQELEMAKHRAYVPLVEMERDLVKKIDEEFPDIWNEVEYWILNHPRWTIARRPADSTRCCVDRSFLPGGGGVAGINGPRPSFGGSTPGPGSASDAQGGAGGAGRLSYGGGANMRTPSRPASSSGYASTTPAASASSASSMPTASMYTPYRTPTHGPYGAGADAALGSAGVECDAPPSYDVAATPSSSSSSSFFSSSSSSGVAQQYSRVPPASYLPQGMTPNNNNNNTIYGSNRSYNIYNNNASANRSSIGGVESSRYRVLYPPLPSSSSSSSSSSFSSSSLYRDALSSAPGGPSGVTEADPNVRGVTVASGGGYV